MYDPKNGKLRRNKYFNLGFEDMDGWADVKGLADAFVSYVDNYCSPEKHTPEYAVWLLKDCFTVKTSLAAGREILKQLAEDDLKENIFNRDESLFRLRQFGSEELVNTALILLNMNIGPLTVKTKAENERRQCK